MQPTQNSSCYIKLDIDINIIAPI